ncbi:MAG: hypothetical protein JO257_19720 [Deltaproteobacteria bacterium]|nr:hypothetical protein [Deltaproteobacteria bacterium]
MRAVLLAAIASMGLVGCVGQLDDMGTNGNPSGPVGGGTNPNPTPNSQAKAMFDQNVYPIISSKTAASGCAMSGCHMVGNTPGSTQFVAATASDGYGTITSYQALVGNFTPASAGILTQVAAGHNGRMYTADEQQKITAWLNQEVLERGQGTGGGGGSGTTTESPGQATARLMNEWSACMNITDFNSANMATAWGNMQTNNGSRCESCHATGGYGMIVTQVAESAPNGGPPGLFTTLATNKYYMIQYFSVDLTQPGTGGKMGKIIVNTTSFNGVANAQPPHTEHPTFNATNNQGMTALNQFYTLVSAKVAAGNCGTTKLNPPAQ